MFILIGIVLGFASIGGGFVAMGGHLEVIWQPFEYVIIFGIAFATFLIANPMSTVKDTGKAMGQAFAGKAPKRKDFLGLLGLLYALMRELRTRPRNEVEGHIDDPANSALFQHFPDILKDKELTQFICDYARLIVIGNARSHEIEGLMEQEISTIKKYKTKPAGALSTVAEGMPAIGICAAVLGIVKAMGAIDQSPEVLGSLIAAALVGTFLGIFLSYSLLAPLASNIKTVREKNIRRFVIVKQILLAFMNGAAPQTALEHGRKMISFAERPTIDQVEEKSVNANLGGPAAEAA